MLVRPDSCATAHDAPAVALQQLLGDSVACRSYPETEALCRCCDAFWRSLMYCGSRALFLPSNSASDTCALHRDQWESHHDSTPYCFGVPASTPCVWDSASQAAVTLRRMGTYLEYGRVPAQLQAPLVHALLGTLHIRFACPATASSRVFHWLMCKKRAAECMNCRCRVRCSLDHRRCTQVRLSHADQNIGTSITLLARHVASEAISWQSAA